MVLNAYLCNHLLVWVLCVYWILWGSATWHKTLHLLVQLWNKELSTSALIKVNTICIIRMCSLATTCTHHTHMQTHTDSAAFQSSIYSQFFRKTEKPDTYIRVLESLEMEDQRNINGSIKPLPDLFPTMEPSQTTLLLHRCGHFNQSKAKQRNKQVWRGQEMSRDEWWEKTFFQFYQFSISYIICRLKGSILLLTPVCIHRLSQNKIPCM